MKPVVLTDHAEVVATERSIEFAWIERTALSPEWRETDPSDAEVERRFRLVPERGGRMLRVACVEEDDKIRVVTVFLDRKAKRPA